MQVEDLQQYAKALRYVWSLRLRDAEAAVRMYGKTLVRALPDDATSLLMALCTHYSPRSLGMEEGGPEDKSGLDAASPDQFIHCYVDHPDHLQRFLQYVVDEDTASAGGLRSSVVHETGADQISLDMLTGGSAAEPAAGANGGEARSSLSKTVWNTLLELYLRPREDDDEPVAPSAAPTPGGVTHRPRTRAWLPSFPLHTPSNPLTLDPSSTRPGREERERTALELLQNPRAAYDVNHALVLVQGAEFKPGQLYLYERLQMYHMVIQHYLDAGDMDAVVKTCRRHGTKDPNLWIQVLSVMATRCALAGHAGRCTRALCLTPPPPPPSFQPRLP